MSFETAFVFKGEVLVLVAPVRFALDERCRFFFKGREIDKPHLGTVFSNGQGNHCLLALRSTHFGVEESLAGLVVRYPDGSEKAFPALRFSPQNLPQFLAFFQQLPPSSREAVMKCWGETIGEQFELSADPAFRSATRAMLAALEPAFTAHTALWLTPSLLFAEMEVHKAWPGAHLPLTLYTEDKAHTCEALTFQITHDRVVVVAQFEGPAYKAEYESFQAVASLYGHPVAVQGSLSTKAYSLEFPQWLNARPAYQIHMIREKLAGFLLDQVAKFPALREAVSGLLAKLQQYVEAPLVSFDQPSAPFSIHFEQVIPLGLQGIFLSGWMRDPFKTLEKIEVISALGFRLLLMPEQIFAMPRPDVNEHFRATRYGGFNDDVGFLAYLPLPESIAHKLAGVAQLHGFRFVLHLKGDVTQEVVPDIRYLDVFTSRDFVLKLVPSSHVSERMLHQCIGPAGSHLQAMCMEQIAIREVFYMGRRVENPVVSLVVPLYKRLEFIKAQFATMANDPAMRECELIYVLDSPWQEQEVKELLREYAHLYQLCVTLAVMRCNSGYAAATNAGTTLARGDYVVLLNSDVFPRAHGWTAKMVDFYKREPKAGAVTPKLVYEDHSLQHAGMYYAKTTYPDWIVLHHYKGYGNTYPLAMKSRPVPAVTGACLMMPRALYEDLGRLSTDYVIGDFEDSDLCLKAVDAGYENWYFADAELYHLERQSVPLNESYTGGIAWRYNAKLHTERWNHVIERQMAKYPLHETAAQEAA
jgi:GT2 family glycosyltransferase